MSRLFSIPAALLLLHVALAAPAAAAPAPRKPVSHKPASKPAARPAPAVVTPANLAASLKGLGLATTSQEGYQQLRVEEQGFAYVVDLRFSDSGEWLVCMAHLAPIPDLSKVPAAPLLALLTTNDNLLGMSFSYNRAAAQIMLNDSIPGKGLTPAVLLTHLQRLRGTILQTQELWNTTKW